MARHITDPTTTDRPAHLADEKNLGYEHYCRSDRALQPRRLRARRTVWAGHLVDSSDPKAWVFDHYAIDAGEEVRVLSFTNGGFRGIDVSVEIDTDNGPVRVHGLPAGAFTAVR